MISFTLSKTIIAVKHEINKKIKNNFLKLMYVKFLARLKKGKKQAPKPHKR